MTKTTFDLRMRNEKIQISRLSQIKDEFFHRWALDPWVLLMQTFENLLLQNYRPEFLDITHI